MQTQQINNYWIFPVLLVIGIVFASKQFSLWTIIFLGYLVVRIFCTRNKHVICVSFLCSFFVLCNCMYLEFKETKCNISEPFESTGVLFVLPDKIRVDGDQLQLEGIFTGAKTNGLKVIASYKISSEKEKSVWANIKVPVKLYLSGTFEKPIGQTNLNGFDYRKYLKEKGIYQTIKVISLNKIQASRPSMLQIPQWLSMLRKSLILHCERVFFKETAQYIKVLLLGYKTNEFSEFSEILAELGILHLFSLSGMHVVFFILLFRYFLLRIGISVEKVFWLQIFFSFIYAGLTGYSISVLRALMQANINAAKERFNVKISTLDCWSISLLISIFIHPYILFSVAGQLSYMLSFFILYIHPISKQVKSSLGRSFVFSLLLNICTIPIIGISFFEWQFAGIFFTFLLLPYFEKVLLPLLSISFFVSFFSQFRYWIQGLEYYFTLQTNLFYWLNKYLSYKLVIGSFSKFLFVGSFISILLFVYYLEKKSNKVWFVLALLILILNHKYLTSKEMVAFIDVGQGDSIFLQAPFHQENILIDTGGKMDFEKESWAKSASKKINAEYSVIPFLKSQGVQYLDKVFITHGHADHFGDLVKINEKIPVRALYFPSGTEKSQEFSKAIRILQKTGTKCYAILASDNLESCFDLQILAPKNSGIGGNDDSLVIQTIIAKRRFLFTGDLEKRGEQELVRRYPNQTIDVLKVGHHGSKTSTTDSFVQNFQPKEAIISCGRNNRFKHPNEETLQVLERNQTSVFRTDTMGMIYYEWYGIGTLHQAKIIKEQD